jgi:hypothetical protein
VISSVSPHPRPALRTSLALVALAILTAWGLLATGIFRYLPHVLNTDEAAVVSRALSLGKLGLNPRWFWYPSLSFYLLAFTYGLYFAIAYAAGAVHSVRDCVALYVCRPAPFYVIARSLAALSIGITIALAYRVGRRVFSEKAAVVGSCLIALSPLLVDFGSTVRIENYQLPFLAAAMLLCLDIVEIGSWKSYLLAGLLTGFATSVKYPGALMFVSVMAAHACRAPQSGSSWHRGLTSPRLWGALAFVAIGFVTTTPFALIDHRAFIEDLTNVRAIATTTLASSDGQSYCPWLGPLARTGYCLLLRQLWSEMGAPAAVFGLTALVWCARRLGKAALVAAFPLSFLLYIGWHEGVREYWLVAVAPFALLAAAGLLLDGVPALLQRVFPPRLARVIAWCAVAIVAASSAWPALRICVERGHQDTRVQAHDWFVAHVPPGSAVLLDYGRYLARGSVPLPETPTSLFRRLPQNETSRVRALSPLLSEYYAVQASCASAGYELETVVHDPWLGQVANSRTEKPDTLAAYRSRGVKYAVLQSSITELYESPELRKRFPGYVQPYLDLYASVRREGHLIQRFEPKPWHEQGPSVEIFEFAADPAASAKSR